MMFPQEGRQFLRDLIANNNRDWFNEHKATYEKHVKEPAAALSATLAEALSEHLSSPVETKIFRLHRDVRFSKDKTPYNGFMRFGFWESEATAAKAMSGPAFYLSIEAHQLIMGAGCMALPSASLEAYRQQVSADGDKLEKLIKKLARKGARFEAPALKRVPQGYNKDHQHGPLLRRKGLTCWIDQELGATTDVNAQDCLQGFMLALPIYNFVRALD